jgi:hypothetical protein
MPHCCTATPGDGGNTDDFPARKTHITNKGIVIQHITKDNFEVMILRPVAVLKYRRRRMAKTVDEVREIMIGTLLPKILLEANPILLSLLKSRISNQLFLEYLTRSSIFCNAIILLESQPALPLCVICSLRPQPKCFAYPLAANIPQSAA